MSVPAFDELAGSEPLAGRAVITHLTIRGERLAFIVPAALMESLRILVGLLASSTPSPSLPAVLAQVYPWATSLPADALHQFAADLSQALRAGDDVPDEMEAALVSWRSTAEAYADPDLMAALRQKLGDYGPVPDPTAK
jgi:hypothetical protein